MRRALTIVFWTTVVGAVLYIAFSKYDIIERLEAHGSGKIEVSDASRIWFSRTGELVAIRADDSELTVRVWSNPGEPAPRERHFTVNWSEKGPASKQPHIYAVAEDASKAAWISSAGLRVQPLKSPAGEGVIDRPFKRRPPVSALAFIGSGDLAILYSDGELEIWDVPADTLRASKHLELTDPGPLLSSGPYLATYSRSNYYAFVLDAGAGDKLLLLEYKKYPQDSLAVTLSPLGRFAMVVKERIELQADAISAPGPVRTLAFYDRNRVFAAGDFEGIYLLGRDFTPTLIAQAPPGTTLIAANNSLVAFGNGQTVNLVSHKFIAVKVYRGLGQPSPMMMLALLGIVLPVLIYALYGAMRLTFRRAAKPPPEAPPVARPDEGPIPNALIEACRNGDCVLYAGSGLGAQAGLATWRAFVPELAKWAGDKEFEGQQPGVVADRIAVTVESRQEALRDFLLQRFWVKTEISEAHRLIKDIEFPSLITTSMDNLLDRTFPYSGGRVHTARDCGDLAVAAKRRDFFLLKPFADLEGRHTISIGPAQCAEVVRNNPPLSDLMEELFTSRTLLFLGASLEGIEQDLQNLALTTPVTHRHFALVPDYGDAWKIVAERLKTRYGIEALTYIPSTPSHPEFVEFLTNLTTAVHARASSEEFFAAGE